MLTDCETISIARKLRTLYLEISQFLSKVYFRVLNNKFKLDSILIGFCSIYLKLSRLLYDIKPNFTEVFRVLPSPQHYHGKEPPYNTVCWSAFVLASHLHQFNYIDVENA